MKKLLSLDLSLSNTGFAIFDLDSHELLEFGELRPSNKGLGKKEYPEKQILRIQDLCEQILGKISPEIQVVIIEEVNRGIGRLSQKILAMSHGILLDRLQKHDIIERVLYLNSDGKDGWRSAAGLKLQLSEAERAQNKEIRKTNRKLKSGKKLPVIDIKQLACNFVNARYPHLKLDVKTRKRDSDICDALGLGIFYLEFVAK